MSICNPIVPDWFDIAYPNPIGHAKKPLVHPLYVNRDSHATLRTSCSILVARHYQLVLEAQSVLRYVT